MFSVQKLKWKIPDTRWSPHTQRVFTICTKYLWRTIVGSTVSWKTLLTNYWNPLGIYSFYSFKKEKNQKYRKKLFSLLLDKIFEPRVEELQTDGRNPTTIEGENVLKNDATSQWIFVIHFKKIIAFDETTSIAAQKKLWVKKRIISATPTQNHYNRFE